MTPRRIVFVGPTLPPDLRPDLGCEYLPPVRHGDLFAQRLAPSDQVLIIDGVYQHYAPIRHKEILAQLARGVRVAGTASLGALRAAELDGFGMRGLGRVYELARTGQLVADADVAVLQVDDEEFGSRRLTVALVSVRHAVAELAQAGWLSAADADLLDEIAASLHFCERSERALQLVADAAGHGAAMRRVLAHLELNDVKTRDALDALDALDTLTDADALAEMAAGRRLARRVWRSSHGEEWDFERRPLRPGSAVPSRLALACLQLFAADFPDRHRAYALRLASATTGRTGPAAAVLAAAGFAAGSGTSSELALATPATAAWLAEDRLLARTFRLRPGRLAYLTIPPEALAGTTEAELESWCTRLLLPPGTRPATSAQCHHLMRDLWQAHTPEQYRLSLLERGFRDPAEVARMAAAFNLELVAHLAHPAAVPR